MKACNACESVVEDSEKTCSKCGNSSFDPLVAVPNNICEGCGYVGTPITKTPGTTGTQVALFVLGILTLGLVLLVWVAYVIWRIVKTETVCPSCGSPKTMVALSSPLGEKLRKQFASMPSSAPTAPVTSDSLLSTVFDTKQCPYCAETINAAARLCRYCGRNLEPAAAAIATEPARVAGQRGAASPVLVAVLCIAAVAAVFVVRAALAAHNANEELAQAKVQAAMVDLHTIGNCLDLYKVEYRRYPTTEEGLETVVNAGKCKPSYKDPWGHDYAYFYPGRVHPKSYDLVSYGSDGKPGGQGDAADIVNE